MRERDATPALAPDAVLNSLCTYVESRNFSGFDPYDALNSPFVGAVTSASRWARIAATQLLRRSPIDFRPALGIQPGHNPKALALFLEGYARLHTLRPSAHYRRIIDHLIGFLADCRSADCSGNAWGYNFDWQSRAFFVPKGTPNVVCSAFVGHALLDAHRALPDQRPLDLAAPIAQFLMRDLRRIPAGDTFCFSYTPLDHYAVHNASVLGASLLVRLAGITGDSAARAAAEAALSYTLRCQRADGSWYYSEAPGSHWIDSFHTGFVLEGLRHFLRSGGADLSAAYRRGVQFYAANFVAPDGAPKYYPGRVYPIDIHSAAELIYFFSCEPSFRELSGRAMRWTLANMQDRGGHFYFRRTRWYVNRISYMRWSQAWMFRALASLLAQASSPGGRESGGSPSWTPA